MLFNTAYAGIVGACSFIFLILHHFNSARFLTDPTVLYCDGLMCDNLKTYEMFKDWCHLN